MEWTEEAIGRLTALWSEGHSTAEIGRRMGVSKNAIVGKAHRLALAARPSPIRRGGAGQAPRRVAPRRIVGPTLPSMAAAAGSFQHPAGAAAGCPMAPPPAAPVEVKPRPVTAPRPGRRPIACCWPLGEPGTRSFRFCEAEAVPGKPYCDEHAQLAYVRVRDRREEAA